MPDMRTRGRVGSPIVAVVVVLIGASVLAWGGAAGASRQDPPPAARSPQNRDPYPVAGFDAARQALMTADPEADRGFQGSVAPNPCYYSVWNDPHDAPQLDGQTYGAAYDCPSKTWRFSVVTSDSWPDSELDVNSNAFFIVPIDADTNLNTGCGGFEYSLQGGFVGGTLRAALFSQPNCATATLVPGSGAAISRNDTRSVELTLPNASLGSPKSLGWFMALRGAHESTIDFMPDDNATPNFHGETGYTGGGCEFDPFGTSPGSYAVVDDAPAAAATLAAAGRPGVQALGQHRGVIRFTGDPVPAADALYRQGRPATVAADHPISYLDTTPNDVLYPAQWYLPAVKAPKAWDHTKGSSLVVVADLDSGVDGTHPDLAGKLVPGFDAEHNVPLSEKVNSDNVGHGTATAGVIGAATDNGINVASLGWNTKVMPIKLGDNPTVSAEIAGLQYAADNHVPIVNLSVGGPCPVAAEAAAVSAAQSKGVLIVASAGNDALRGDRPSYPAAYPGVLAVGATGFDGTRAAYSNVGAYVDLVAPGGSSDGIPTHNMLLLAPGGGVSTAAGTSFSAPLVSAAAALVRAVDPSITPANIASLLMSTATDLGPPGRDSSYGMGLLNVDAAVVQAATPPPTTAPPTTATTAPPSTASPTTAAPATATTVPAAGRQFQAAVSPVATPQNRMPTFTG